METKPFISVIIPVYNVEKYIIKCIKSVVEQDIEAPLEIILVDDCGQDNSIKIASEYALSICNSSRQIIFLSHETNKGQAAARNTGVKHAKGEYIFFLDSDDFLPKDSFRNLSKYIDGNPAHIIEGQSIHVREDGRISKTNTLDKIQTVCDEDLWEIGNMWMPVCWNKIINRGFFIENNLWFEEGFFYEDLYWSILVALSNPVVIRIPDRTYCYLSRTGSTSRSMSKRHIDSFICLIQNFYKLYNGHCVSHKYKDKILANYERFRSIAIDYVYTSGSDTDRRHLFTTLQKYNIQSCLRLLTNRSIGVKLLYKILPLYTGTLGHHLIVLKRTINQTLSHAK